MGHILRTRRFGRDAVRFVIPVMMLVATLGLPFDELSAQTSSPEGKIAFVKRGTEPSEHCFGQPCTDIWAMDADGSNEVNLTATPDVNEGQPAWSFDGTKIAYASDADDIAEFTDVWVMNADGSNQNDLTPTAADADNFHEYQPAWAPSGTQIVFVREIPGEVISEQADLFVMDADPNTSDDASNVTETDANEWDPAWSPDGTKIAFAGVRDQGFEIVSMDADGQNELVLTGDGFDGEDRAPDWSPDSTKVVFMKQSQVGGCCEPWEIWAVNRDGTGDSNLTDDPSNDTDPSWSPDGTEISFTSNRDATVEDPFRTDIYVIPAPATLPLVGTTALATSRTGAQRLTSDGGSSPDWGESAPDTRSPRVTSTSPVAGATGVSRTVHVRATFSEALKTSSINAQTFKLFREGSTTKVAATVTYKPDAHTATLDPSTRLQRGATYRAIVTTRVKDLAGNALDQNRGVAGQQQKSWLFTVRS